MTSPIRPTDDAARELARALMTQARFAALAVQEPGGPAVSRVAFGLDAAGQPISLMSDLSAHSRALQADPACSLLVGEPGPRGDPLTHPRLTLQARATLIPNDTPEYEEMAAHYLRDHPKAKLYIGFSDFRFARFSVSEARLNGGFGKAFHLTSQDLGL
ncbi:MAG: pyridoxamine 5'-phosphate oxidase family protein [Marinibacterium sp.]|nr:pyridoxamine 5'-phosphate oxidase family protein [Marinibacterium sp.]